MRSDDPMQKRAADGAAGPPTGHQFMGADVQGGGITITLNDKKIENATDSMLPANIIKNNRYLSI
jgi:hypothetical protein